jgi:hypothetical protein
MYNIPQQRDLLLKTFRTLSNTQQEIISTCENKLKSIKISIELKINKNLKQHRNSASIGTHSKSQTPPFFLTFEIFNYNIHNYMEDSRLSSNVMPYSICKNTNGVPSKCTKQIIQLERFDVKVIAELKDIMINLSSNPKVYQIIFIIIVDIPKD